MNGNGEHPGGIEAYRRWLAAQQAKAAEPADPVTDALSVLGQEILRLRQENALLKERLRTHNSHPVAARTSDPLAEIPRMLDTLQRLQTPTASPHITRRRRDK